MIGACPLLINTVNKLLSIIIPAYNEERTIEVLIEKALTTTLPQGLEREVIVVNDGSTDQTLNFARSWEKSDKVKVFNKANGGKASAVKHGLAQAKGDILLIQDADLEYDPKEYVALLQPILLGQTQVVYGSRFLGNIQDMKFINRAANNISNWTMRLLWGAKITDINTCYKVFTKEAYSGITITSAHFAMETELTIKFIKKGLTIIEVPITYQARSRKQGKKINWRTALEMYWPIVKYRFFSN